MKQQLQLLYHEFDLARIAVMRDIGYGINGINHRNSHRVYGSPESIVAHFTVDGAFSVKFSIDDITKEHYNSLLALYIKAQTYIYYRDGREKELVLWKLSLREAQK